MSAILLSVPGLSACAGNSDVDNLVSGTRQVRAKRIRITGQQRQADCESPALMEFFNRALKSNRTSATGGVFYTMQLESEDGGKIKIPFVISRDQRITLLFSDMDRGRGLDLQEPIPKEAKELFAFLTAERKNGTASF